MNGAGMPSSALGPVPRADDVFETRLFGPYQDALPPPGHVHPGHLVVNKPDLGPEHWVAAGVAECRCGGASGAAACGRHGGGRGDAERPCRWGIGDLMEVWPSGFATWLYQ